MSSFCPEVSEERTGRSAIPRASASATKEWPAPCAGGSGSPARRRGRRHRRPVPIYLGTGRHRRAAKRLCDSSRGIADSRSERTSAFADSFAGSRQAPAAREPRSLEKAGAPVAGRIICCAFRFNSRLEVETGFCFDPVGRLQVGGSAASIRGARTTAPSTREPHRHPARAECSDLTARPVASRTAAPPGECESLPAVCQRVAGFCPEPARAICAVAVRLLLTGEPAVNSLPKRL